MFGTFKFALGQPVELVNVTGASMGTFAIREQFLDHQGQRNLYRLRGSGSISAHHYSEDQLRLLPPTCIVCGQVVMVKSGIVQRHTHKGHTCYGSFMPEDAVPFQEKIYGFEPQQYVAVSQ